MIKNGHVEKADGTEAIALLSRFLDSLRAATVTTERLITQAKRRLRHIKSDSASLVASEELLAVLRVHTMRRMDLKRNLTAWDFIALDIATSLSVPVAIVAPELKEENPWQKITPTNQVSLLKLRRR